MPVRNLHNKPFDEGTQEKLELYRDYLCEWLHVFINTPSVGTLQIFDFFAGPGIDSDGNPGSPAITCREISDVRRPNLKQRKEIRAYFNEYDIDKFNNLLTCIEKHKCSLPQVAFSTMQTDFPSAFEKWKPVMNGRVANLLFLDQNGVKQITESIFKTIVQLPKTDFLFFISSAMINRFKNQSEIRDYVPVTDDDFSRMNGSNVHRIAADAYRRWIPGELQYYLGSFSIRKGANVYGLVFGSAHPLGIDKFLRVAWKRGGDANFDIDGDGIDPTQSSLFPAHDKPSKIKLFEKELESAVLERRLSTNKDVYLFALRSGMLATHARDALKLMIKDEKLPKQSFKISYDAWRKPNAETIRLF